MRSESLFWSTGNLPWRAAKAGWSIFIVGAVAGDYPRPAAPQTSPRNVRGRCPPLVEIHTLDHAKESKPSKGRRTSSLGLSPEEERQIIHTSLDQRYAKMLDENVPGSNCPETEFFTDDYLPRTDEIIPADMATPSPDDRFHHCTHYPILKFDRWSEPVWEGKEKTRCFFAPMNSW